ncbi:MAG: AAA family ATPase [Candidatus Hatepunaea meridiana]|nr:AAA family ATPase [Candidatus Hatepunaea meridiana]
MIPRILRIEVKNFRSIKQAAVNLEPFTVLVGPNGSGKSNFARCIWIISNCLSDSIEYALSPSYGFEKFLYRGAGRNGNIGLRIIVQIEDNSFADYSFEIAASQNGTLRVSHERCVVVRDSKIINEFEVKDGEFEKHIEGIHPQIRPGRLALYAASATDSFRPLYDFLISMRYYNINPYEMKKHQGKNPSGDYLQFSGYNAALILEQLTKANGNRIKYERLCRLMKLIVNDVEGVMYNESAKSIQFQVDGGSEEPWIFDIAQMSEGTLRVLGILLALYQGGQNSVICIEEPEAIVHPAAMEVLVQAMLEVAHERQVIITTHSPDILDFKYIKAENIRIVTSKHSQTRIATVSESSRKIIREHLSTPGELLRIDELNPDTEEADNIASNIDIFGEPFSCLKLTDG